MAEQSYKDRIYNAEEVLYAVQKHLGLNGRREPDIRHAFRMVYLDWAKRESRSPYSAKQQNYDYQLFLGSGQLPIWMMEFYIRNSSSTS